MERIDDTFDLVDRELDVVKREKDDRRIKFRQPSFEAISSSWKKKRFSSYTKALREAKTSLMAESFQVDENHNLTEKSMKKLDKKTKAIAKLEEKILVLAKENVPSDYRERRAIKLKQNMINNLSYNANNAYVVGIKKAERIFEDDIRVSDDLPMDTLPISELEEIGADFNRENSEEITVEGVEDAFAPESESVLANDSESDNVQSLENNFDVFPTSVQREEIRDAISEEFDKVKGSDNLISAEEVMSTVNGIGREDINSVISEQMDAIVTPEENSTPFVGIDTDTNEIGSEKEIGAEDISSIINEEMNAIQPSTEEEIPESTDLGVDSVMDIIDSDDTSISRNNSSAARIDRFDENGELKVNESEQEPFVKYNYTPMSDEEIAQARANIEYDKYNDLYNEMPSNESEQIRELPAIVPERSPYPDYMVNNNDYNTIVNDLGLDTNKESTGLMVPNFNDVFVRTDKNLPSISTEPIMETLPLIPKRSPYPDYMYNNDNNNLHFDYTDATANDLNNAVEQTSSLSEAELLMKRALELRAKQQETKNQMEEKRRKAEEVEKKQQEVEKAAQAKIERLRVFTEAVEEDCAYNEAAARQAEEIAAENAAKIRANEELINEIDSIIGGEAINVSVRGR